MAVLAPSPPPHSLMPIQPAKNFHLTLPTSPPFSPPAAKSNAPPKLPSPLASIPPPLRNHSRRSRKFHRPTSACLRASPSPPPIPKPLSPSAPSSKTTAPPSLIFPPLQAPTPTATPLPAPPPGPANPPSNKPSNPSATLAVATPVPSL